MTKAKLLVAALALMVIGAGLWHFRTRGEGAAHLKSGAVVIVELFSAEGCSSCPPADGYIATLDRDQPIEGVTVIALELHVDYWDRLGWTDPFGSHEFSERQSQYARVLDNHSIFTPEIVFDGSKLMVGGDEARAREQMLESAREPKARVAIELTGRGKLAITVTDTPEAALGDAFEVWLAVTESHLESDVRAGENQGRVLAHAPIVRQMRKLGVVTEREFRGDAAVEMAMSWKPKALRFVAFVQGARSRKIVGAGACNAGD